MERREDCGGEFGGASMHHLRHGVVPVPMVEVLPALPAQCHLDGVHHVEGRP